MSYPQSKTILALLSVSSVLFLGATPTTASPPTSDGFPVCTAVEDQELPQAAPDGAEGAIIAWKDARRGSGNVDVYAQRIDAAGATLWTLDGVIVCSSGAAQAELRIIPDGSGGAIIAWEDGRSAGNDIYAQRLDPDGVEQWTPDGVLIGSASSSPAGQELASDGAGGAILAWENNIDIVAQRVDGAGAVSWTSPVEVCGKLNQQTLPKLVEDGSGGAIITWEDHRNSPNHEYEIFAQKVDGDGNVLWTLDGVQIRSAAQPEKNWDPQIVSDGMGGAIIAWEDLRSSPGSWTGIYAQRVDADGNTLWMMDGNVVCNTVLYPLDDVPSMASDGAGGAIITWRDDRGTSPDIFAQRVSGSGAMLWQLNGEALCVFAGDQVHPRIVPDQRGGATVVWRDDRSGETDIWAQRVNAYGDVMWEPSGTSVCSATGPQDAPHLAPCTDGAIITWRDGRGTDRDIYADSLVEAYSPGVAYCPGDGSGGQCFCMNFNDGSMGGCRWHAVLFPTGGQLGAHGSNSVSAGDLVLQATSVENNWGLYFQGSNQVNGGAGAPFGDGLRCAGGALIRLQTVLAHNHSSQTTVNIPQRGLCLPGDTRYYQLWFRTVPGACGWQFNLTNGYEVTWGS